MSNEYTNPALRQQLFCETWFVRFPCTCAVTQMCYWNTNQHNVSQEIMIIRWSGLLEWQIVPYFKLMFCLFICLLPTVFLECTSNWCEGVIVFAVHACRGAIFMFNDCSVKYLFSSWLLHPMSWRKLSGKARTIFRAVLDAVLTDFFFFFGLSNWKELLKR